MKVLHIVKTSEGATWAYRQIKVLLEKGVEVHVIVPSKEGKLPELLKSINIPLYEVNLNTKNIRTLFKVSQRLREIVECLKPDIIHSHFVLTTYLLRLALYKSNIPRVFQVPGPLHLEKGPYGFIDKFLAKRNDYWVATCDWTQKKYIKLGIDSERVFKSYYGTDTDRFLNQNSKDQDLRKELNIPDDAPLIGMVAFMYPPKKYLGQKRGIKGHEDFIDAIAILKKKLPEIRAIIVGGTWGTKTKYETELKKRAKEKCGDSILFLGYRSDIPRIYNSMDIAVHPSHSENLGGAVESMLAGIPTIATNVGGFPDIVIDNKTGWLVEPKHPVNLANKIYEVISNKGNSKIIAQEGLKNTVVELNVEKTGEEIYLIYLELIKRNKNKNFDCEKDYEKNS